MNQEVRRDHRQRSLGSGRRRRDGLRAYRRWRACDRLVGGGEPGRGHRVLPAQVRVDRDRGDADRAAHDTGSRQPGACAAGQAGTRQGSDAATRSGPARRAGQAELWFPDPARAEDGPHLAEGPGDRGRGPVLPGDAGSDHPRRPGLRGRLRGAGTADRRRVGVGRGLGAGRLHGPVQREPDLALR